MLALRSRRLWCGCLAFHKGRKGSDSALNFETAEIIGCAIHSVIGRTEGQCE
jgi:hypothetical protein